MKNRVAGIAVTLLTITGIIGIRTIFHPCEGAMPMVCNYSTESSFRILVLIFTLNALRVYAGDVKHSFIFDITNIVAGVEIVYSCHVERCQVLSMNCNTGTCPFLSVVTLLIAVISIVSILISIINERRLENGNSE